MILVSVNVKSDYPPCSQLCRGRRAGTRESEAGGEIQREGGVKLPMC